ncbi:MAG: HEAT repeat domain-containing protein [Spirochaetaceae bacterium]|jgi:HEAT repeat protein|nr:HEAT repeat domain-containing protein [Spirochaetaceae bacterium]
MTVRTRYFIICFLPLCVTAFAADSEETQRDILKYGTDNEISELIKTLKKDNAEYLDGELFELVRDTRNSVIRAQVIVFFTERGKDGLEKEAVDLIENRDDVEASNVLAAISYLGKVKYGKAQPALRSLLEAGEERYTAAAIRAIGGAVNSGNADETAAFLIDYYEKKNPAEDLQREIVWALGETGAGKASAFLADIITTNERPALSIAALDAAGKIAGKEAREAVIDAVSSKDPNVRAGAVGALARFEGDDVDKTLLDAFRDSYYRTRLAAVKAAGTRKLKAAVPYLKFRAEKDETPAVREEAARSLGGIGNAECADALEKIFTDKKTPDKLRGVCAEMLLKIDADRYAEQIVSAFDEAKRTNQKQLSNALINALSKAKTKKVIPLTRRLFASKDALDKAFALELTAINGFSELTPEVRRLAEAENSGLSRKAKDVLSRLSS